jgi:NAD(P)-dependent dehydrogenase (short-subunit alcohol dehydrogenase family)
MSRLTDRVAIVTGGASARRATVRRFVAEGARVTLPISTRRGTALARFRPRGTVLRSHDRSQCRGAVEATLAFRRARHLHINAGAFAGPVEARRPTLSA